VRSGFEAGWRRRFEDYGDSQDDDAGIAGWTDSGLQARVRNFLRSWQPLGSEGVWLDAGCGAGTYSRAMATAGQRVVGLDYSVPSLLKARARSDKKALFWIAGDATQLPFPSASFDGAICFGVLQALSDPVVAIAELSRVVRPGGQVWVDALNAYCLPTLLKGLLERVRKQERHLRYDPPRSLRRAFEHNGLSRVRVMWVPILPARAQRLQPVFESEEVRAALRLLPPIGSALSHAYVVTGERERVPESRFTRWS
jgi:SAM-dependent methyltransferase